jgi:hypothetical protein
MFDTTPASLRLSGYGLAAAAITVAACSTDPGGSGPTGQGGSAGAATSSSNGVTGTMSASSGKPPLPASFFVEGTVIDGRGIPVSGAMVLQGGRSYEPPHFISQADGSFSIELLSEGYGIPTVVAAKIGYRAAGTEFFSLPTGAIELRIRQAVGSDNPDYKFADPGDENSPTTAHCGHCHNTFTAQFLSSKHAQATKNPLVQDVYAGVSQAHANGASCTAAGGEWKQGLNPGTASDAVTKCYLGGGTLPDLNPNCGGTGEPRCDDPAISAAAAPTAFGACADCHAPGIDGTAGGRNLHEAVGIAYDNGVHCDVCHKVSDVDLSKPAGVGQRLILHRPNEPSAADGYLPIFFGPLIDVPNGFMLGSYQPKFNQAVLCAGCHEHEQPALIPGENLDPQRWPDGLPVHSTYSEWLAGPYNSADTPCQMCHMPPNFDMVNNVDVTKLDNQSITFGFRRPPEDNRQHIFRSPLFHGEPRLIDQALFVSIDLEKKTDEVEATISVANVGCGHAIPTGEPMRSLVMLVTADGVGCGQPLGATGGMTINDIGGTLARGVIGQGASLAGTDLNWPAAATLALAGQVIRVVQPSGVFDDYAGVGFFADPNLSANDKGLEIAEPVGEASVIGAVGGVIQLSQALTVAAGDVVYLGDPATTLTDGQASRQLAGAAGYTFAKVLLDAAAVRGVPHHRAIDIASDNRIPPGDKAITSHRFAMPPSCTSATVRATVLYRPLPTALASLRGWQAKDYIIATAENTITP